MDVAVSSPFPFEALPRIWHWIEGIRHKLADDFSPQTLGEFVSAMAAKWEQQKSWAVYADGELGGLITFEELSPWLGTAHCIFKPEFQGKGLAVRACRIAVGEMFACSSIGKLAFYPLAGNLAIGSLLINLGASREGRMIGHTLCKGKPADILVYGLSKGDFERASINSSRDRRGIVDPRVVSIRQAEADNHDHDTDLVA